jgi:class 3 adenylate cyclase
MLGFVAFALILWIETPDLSLLQKSIIGFFLAWPHIVYLTSIHLAPSRRSAQFTVVLDCVLFGFVWTTFNSLAVLGLGLSACTVNSLSVGGFRTLAASLLALTISICIATAISGLPGEFSAPSTAAYIASSAFTTLYCGAVGFSTYVQSRRVAHSKRQLREFSRSLEDKVAERTNDLRSANEAFLRFVPSEFLRTLGYDDIAKARLGDATRKSLTILFADVRNFTTISESMTPEETFAFLNSCLSRVGPHVRVHGGFIDKYIGDAIMALFPGDPACAVRAALAMQQEAARYNTTHPDAVPLVIGVGVHVGMVMMGTIGETERFEVTVISDAVNLTARLESLTKQFGCSILVSDEVAGHLDESERTETRWLGSFSVKGKATPVELIEFFASDEPALRAHKTRTRLQLRAGIDHFRSGELKEAEVIFREIVDLQTDDGPARWWLARVHQELASGQPGRPQAVVRLEAK